jgi:hypothetical protein
VSKAERNRWSTPPHSLGITPCILCWLQPHVLHCLAPSHPVLPVCAGAKHLVMFTVEPCHLGLLTCQGCQMGGQGLEHCWAGLGAPVNKCQQCGKHCNQRSQDVCSSRGIFGWEKYIFGFRVFNYTYWALVRTRGQVRWDGFQWMGLDDDVPIRKVLPFRDVLIARDSGSLLGMVFCGQKVLC